MCFYTIVDWSVTRLNRGGSRRLGQHLESISSGCKRAPQSSSDFSKFTSRAR